MSFSNPITGGQGTLVRPAIKSPDYIPDVSGWSINRDGSAEFNNLVVRGVFQGQDFIINEAGIFVYNGTPAAGNLTESMAAQNGVDQFGNAYLQGIVNYAGDDYVQVALGNVVFGLLDDTNHPGLIGIKGDGSGVFYQSATSAPFSDRGTMFLQGGDSTLKWNDASFPHLFVGESDFAGTGLWTNTAVVKASLTTSNPEIWRTPTFGTNWASATSFNGNAGFNPLEYRMDAEDNVWLFGLAQSSGALTTVTTLPAAYRPQTGSRPLVGATFNIGGTVHPGAVQVTETGVVACGLTVSGVTIASGSQVFINGKFPLGNIN